MSFKDLTGQRFGRLTVVERLPAKKNRKTRWRCVCDCGKETEATIDHLTSGNTRSCGCLAREAARARHLEHGGKGTRLYNIWKNARQRCRNPKNPDFKDYGARGVQFTREWEGFGKFREWSLANGYRDDLTLDRIDVDGNYCPENCRWTTWKEQRHNQRRNKEVMP